MENTEELESKVLDIVREQHKIDGGHNGVSFGAFDHFLDMSLEERNKFIYKLASEKKIVIFQSLNAKRITLPK
jgi:hypothetical protein